MLGMNLRDVILLVIGLLFGALIASSSFRVNFFKGLRGFLSGIGKGAHEQDKRTKEDLGRMHKGIQNYGSNGRGDKQAQQTKREQDISKSEIHHYEHIKTKCPTCKGTGKVDPPPMNRGFGAKLTCKNCQGRGWTWN